MDKTIFQVIRYGVCNDYERLNTLLDEGLNPNIAFHQALSSGNGSDYDLLLFLIGKGADVNSYGPRGVALADFRTPLSQAIISENLGLVSFLLESGADVNQLTRGSGWFPLHCVFSIYGNNTIPIAKMLLHYGADPHKSNENEKESPYQMAKRVSDDDTHHKIVEMMEAAIVSV